jgi:outer membrane receptor protein involved in Fe transport
MNRTSVRLISLLAILAVFSISAFGQGEAGSISGTVRDASGAVVKGATVTTKSLATSAERSVQTGDQGQFNVPGLPPGDYSVKITSAGFKTFEASVTVAVGSISTVDAQMTVGATSQVVEVVAGAAAQVNTETQALSQLIDTQQLAQLPSLTRNPYDFVAVSGNVSNGDNTQASGGSQELTARGVGYSLNGQRETGTEILLDGVENIGLFSQVVGEDVPIDSVQEYNIVTNNFAAEYGRASGGVVNVSTKSGTNNWHGSLWEFNRLSAYTANTYANDAANYAAGSIVAPKGTYTRNQFGFDVGGPILKNKLFVYAATEWTRVRSEATETEEILDPSFISMLPGNTQAYFSQYGTGALPASGKVTTAGQLAGAGLTVGPINGVTVVPASQPVFDTVNFKAPFNAGGGVPENAYTFVGRIDFNWTDKTTMFFRYGRESGDQFPGSAFYSTYPQYDVGTSFLNNSFLYNLSHTFSNTIFNNSKISFVRFDSFNSFDTALTGTPNLMFVSPTDPVTGIVIQMPGLENYSEPGVGGLPYGGPQNQWQFEDNLSWTKGRHTMKFGGVYYYIQLNVSYGAYAQAVEQLGATPQDSMNSLTNAIGNPGGSQLVSFQTRVNPNGVLPCHTDSLGNLIESPNCAVTPPLSPAQYARSYRYHDWGLYAQDSWKVTPRLTLNYGLRYEHYGVQRNSNQALDSNFYCAGEDCYGPNLYENVQGGQVFNTLKSPVGGFWAPRWGTLGPRVGFAWDVFGDGKTSLRAGYGISYERNFGNVTYNASFNPPASAVLNATCGASSVTCTTLVTNNNLGPLGQPGPPSYLPPTEIRMPNPNINVAQTQFWSAAVQRQLGKNTMIEVSYSGAKGNHLYDIENINLLGAAQFYLGAPVVTSPDCNPGNVSYNGVCLTRPNNQYSNLNMRGSLGISMYNAANIKFQTQPLGKTGMYLVANYTWAHALDNISSTFSDSLQGGSGYIGSLGYTTVADPKLDYGNADYDVRHRFVLSPVWQTPWFNSGKGWERQALGGWTVSGIYTVRSGIPFTIYDYTNDFNFYTVPRLTPGGPYQSSTGTPVAVGPNLFNVLTAPLPASFAPLDPTLGISDFGPYPAGMTARNAFRGPGAWNLDLAVTKNFKLTERFALEFRAEGYDIFNHHNYYVNTTNLLYDGPTTVPLQVTALKGGLGSLATGGNNDQRRFGQFALRLKF